MDAEQADDVWSVTSVDCLIYPWQNQYQTQYSTDGSPATISDRLDNSSWPLYSDLSPDPCPALHAQAYERRHNGPVLREDGSRGTDRMAYVIQSLKSTEEQLASHTQLQLKALRQVH